MAAYTKNMKIHQMRDCIRVDAQMMQEKNYQARCNDELDISQMEQDQMHELYEREGRSHAPLDEEIFSFLESILKRRLAVPPSPKSSWNG